ncbi:MAG: hypothetical protein JXJ04_24240 [Spirochaetales bacterium]|nr:hypothetical protein [Spirochaetales bacterium]
MVVLIYFLISLIGGIIPAFLARQMKKNFVLWWIYGVFFLPVALLHVILLKLKLEKGIIAVRILLVVFGVLTFYFVTWAMSTQPAAMKWFVIGENKYAIGKVMYENADEITGLTTDVMDYVEKKTKVDRKIIEDELAYFEPNKHTDKEYVQDFGLKLVQSIQNVFIETINKGAYEEWSVPMGDAKKVFTLYLKSLKDLNIYLKDSPTAVDDNYMAYLRTESTYLGKTSIVNEYLDHLDGEAAKNPDDERIRVLIEHYIYIGDQLVKTNQADISLKPYDKAIALYRRILQHGGESVKERAEDLFNIGEIYSKKKDFEAVVSVFKEFLFEYFNGKLFLVEDAIYDLEGYMKLEIVAKDTKKLMIILKEFTDYIDGFSTPEKVDVCKVENRVLEIFFPKLPQGDRVNYIPILKENYDYLISPKNLEVFPIIKEAYTFFDNFKFKDVAQSYIEMLDDVEPVVFAAVDKVKNNVSIGLLADVTEAMKNVEGIFLKSLILTDTMSEEMKALQAKIRENSKTAIDTIVQIKDIMADMEELMAHMERNKELKAKLQTQLENKKLEMNEIQNAISKATKNYNDVVKDIFRENDIRTKEYDAVMAMIVEAQELGDSLGLVPPGQRKAKKADMLKLRAEIKNEVTSLSTIIDNIIAAKNEIAKKYNVTPDTSHLTEIKGNLIELKDEIDAIVEKYFPGELAKLDADA